MKGNKMYIHEAIEQIKKDNPNLSTQASLAEHIGISSPMITTYKNGESKPNILNASKIWELFQIQVEPFTELALQDEVDRRKRVEGMLNDKTK